MSDAPERRAVLAVTMGDPGGIGPEIVLKALRSPNRPEARVLVFGGRAVLDREADRLGLPAVESHADTALRDVTDFPAKEITPREPDAASGRASLDCIEAAVEAVLAGEADALVTGPISKAAIGAAGCPHPGHTEMLADLTGGGKPLMVLVARRLRVAFATTHLPLRDVAEALSAESVTRAVAVLSDGLRHFFGIDAPRIAVCGLNPHCGDAGRFGDEDQRIVAPAAEEARQRGVRVEGPLPADTLFARAAEGVFDGVVALYHDQGMIAVKMEGVHEVVNVTLGLPIIRTSVGHGTAFDIAGRGEANERSLLRAMRLGARMARTAGRVDLAKGSR